MSCLLRIKYFWHWIALTGVMIAIVRTVVDIEFRARTPIALISVLNYMYTNALLTGIMLIVIALPIYLYKAKKSRIQTKTTGGNR